MRKTIEMLEKSGNIDNSLYMQIEVRVKDRLLPIRIEEWCFSCFLAEKSEVFKMAE